VGARLAGGLFTSFSGFVSLTSRELWAEPLPRPEEGEFPIADRRSGWAKAYTNVKSGVVSEIRKTGGRTGFDLWVRPDSRVGQFESTSH